MQRAQIYFYFEPLETKVCVERGAVYYFSTDGGSSGGNANLVFVLRWWDAEPPLSGSFIWKV